MAQERTLKQVNASLTKLPSQLKKDLVQGAGKEVIDEILGTTGIQKYPPAGSGNAPPTPYYVRGRGTQYKTRNDGSSERYGSQWSKPKVSGYKTTATNTASYASHLVGDKQAKAMGRIGWRRIIDVVKDKLIPIGKIYGRWVVRAIRKVGL